MNGVPLSTISWFLAEPWLSRRCGPFTGSGFYFSVFHMYMTVDVL